MAAYAAYQSAPLATPANDAGLIAQSLQAAGFDVTGARDLDGESLRAAFRDFLEKAQASGPDTVAFVYLAGYGLQVDGENYFVPMDAKIASAADVAIEALRISDYTKRLAGLSLKASFVVLDAARNAPFAKSGPPLAGGLALADVEPNMLLAFNATPGTVAPPESGPYGAYARALTEMIREGGLPPSDLFDGVRLRVNEQTKGAQVPWDASRIAASFVFFERAPDAPPPALSPERVSEMRSQPLHDLKAQDAYAAAIDRDTLQGYEDFLAAYPTDALANRVRALLAARREAATWQHTCRVGTPNAYWSYLNRYPQGPHAADARGRLNTLAAAEEPPPSFSPIIYDVPPPPPAEIVYVDRPVLVFDDPEFDFPPPPPIVFLAPPPAYLVFPPPPPPDELFVLPVPVFVPVPIWINPPPYVAPPPENIIFNNIHNTTIINNNNTASNPGSAGAGAGVAAGVAAGVIAAKVALPPSVVRKATLSGQQVPQLKPGRPVAGAPPGSLGPSPSTHLPAGHELPGVTGKPLPAPAAKPGTPAGQPGGSPSVGSPAGPTLPGKPSPGAQQNPPGGPSQNKPTAAHALPRGQELPPTPGAAKRPGTLSPVGQQQIKPPKRAAPPNGSAPSRANGRPVLSSHGPAMTPKPQQSLQRPPQQFQQRPPPQQTYRPPSPPQQTYRPPPPPQQTYRPPPPPQQSYRPPPPQQQTYRPPPQQQRSCGLPGLPACH